MKRHEALEPTGIEEGQEDIDDDLDLSSARRVNQEQKRINVDFPAWVVASLDREAARISGALCTCYQIGVFYGCKVFWAVPLWGNQLFS